MILTTSRQRSARRYWTVSMIPVIYVFCSADSAGGGGFQQNHSALRECRKRALSMRANQEGLTVRRSELRHSPSQNDHRIAMSGIRCSRLTIRPALRLNHERDAFRSSIHRLIHAKDFARHGRNRNGRNWNLPAIGGITSARETGTPASWGLSWYKVWDAKCANQVGEMCITTLGSRKNRLYIGNAARYSTWTRGEV